MNWHELYDLLLAAWHYPLTSFGGVKITLGALVKAAAGLVIVWTTARYIRWKLQRNVLAHTPLEPSTQSALSRTLYYTVLVLGTIIVLDTAGVRVSSLTVFSGFIGVGIGFGMQNIASNFISGIILLVERPIRTGDVISVGDTRGTVESISFRMTRVRSFDNATLFIPNSSLVNGMLTSWTTTDLRFRSSLTVIVPNKQSPERVRELLLEVAGSDARVIEDPAPSVRFKDMSAAAQTFELVVWMRNSEEGGEVPSDLRFAIVKHFEANGISLVTG
jgi:small-conductance mechanosensitive channel